MKLFCIISIVTFLNIVGESSHSEDFQELAMRIASSTVKLSGFAVSDSGAMINSQGTGFVIDSQRTVVSCAHIFFKNDKTKGIIPIIDTSAMTSRNLLNGRISNVHISRVYPQDDIVFLVLAESDPEPVAINPIDSLRVTTPIGCVGSTSSIGITFEGHPINGTVVLRGMISLVGMNLNQDTEGYYHKILVQLGTIPGLSGSPVFSLQTGRVIGMAQEIPTVMKDGVKIVPDITVCATIQRIMSLYREYISDTSAVGEQDY